MAKNPDGEKPKKKPKVTFTYTQHKGDIPKDKKDLPRSPPRPGGTRAANGKPDA